APAAVPGAICVTTAVTAPAPAGDEPVESTVTGPVTDADWPGGGHASNGVCPGSPGRPRPGCHHGASRVTDGAPAPDGTSAIHTPAYCCPVAWPSASARQFRPPPVTVMPVTPVEPSDATIR